MACEDLKYLPSNKMAYPLHSPAQYLCELHRHNYLDPSHDIFSPKNPDPEWRPMGKGNRELNAKPSLVSQ